MSLGWGGGAAVGSKTLSWQQFRQSWILSMEAKHTQYEEV